VQKSNPRNTRVFLRFNFYIRLDLEPKSIPEIASINFQSAKIIDTESNAMQDIQKILEETKGFLDPVEGRRLYEVALEASRRGPCLEIGSYCGKSALYLGSACRENGQVLFSIDHHRGSEEQQPGEAYFDPDLYDARHKQIDTLPFLRRTLARAGLEDTVVPLVCASAVAARSWSTPLALVFIDGGHAFETAWQDYTGWSGYLLSGGYLLIHDIFKDPSKGGQAPYDVYKRAVASGDYAELEMTGTLGVLRRRAAGGAGAAV
jgi:predicted O-methyltransferase YrrM